MSTQDRLDNVEKEIDDLKDTVTDHMESMRADLRCLREDWQKARGIVAGVVLTLSAIGWVVAMIKDRIFGGGS